MASKRIDVDCPRCESPDDRAREARCPRDLRLGETCGDARTAGLLTEVPQGGAGQPPTSIGRSLDGPHGGPW